MKQILKKKLQVSVCIPAYNEEKNIKRLVQSVFEQNAQSFILKEILIASDASTDNTVQIIKKMKEKKVRLIAGKERIGQLQRIAQMIKEATGDIIILLDADIILATAHTLAQLVAPFYVNKKIGLVGGNRKPISVKSFVEKTLQTSMNVYDNIALRLRQGNNPYNCHGCTLALSKKFAHSLNIPKEIFSGDTYLYFTCLYNNFQFQYAPLAKVWIFLPNTFKDAVSQYSRFLGIDQFSKIKYGNLIEKEYQIPFSLQVRYKALELFTHPILCVTMYLMVLYCKNMKESEKNIHPAWLVSESTKQRDFSI